MVARRDAQRQRVYEWEWAYIRPFDSTASADAAAKLSLDQCREIVEHVFCEFVPDTPLPNLNYSPSNVKRRRGKECPATYWPAIHEITLPAWARSHAVVLHEVAHALTRTAHGPEIAGHGPEFAATALALWRCYLPDFDHKQAHGQGLAHGIRFAETWPDRKVLHWADGPCILCGIEPPDPRWRSVCDASFRSDAMRDDVLNYPTETARLQRIFQLELEQPGTVVKGFGYLLRQTRDGLLLPDDHPLRDHIQHHTSPRRYGVLSPGPRRTWVSRALRLLEENG